MSVSIKIYTNSLGFSTVKIYIKTRNTKPALNIFCIRYIQIFFFAAVQSNNVRSEDEIDDESDLDDQKHPDEVDMEGDKGLEIRTMNPCI